VPESQLSISIEHEVAAYLRHVHLLGMPDLSVHGETYVAPDRPRWCDRQKPFSSEPDASITPALGIGKPEVGMPRIVGEALEMVRTSKRGDGDLSVQLRYLLAELPELREELLAVELTEVAEQNQNGGPPHRSARAEDLSVKVRTSKARSMCIDADRSEERSKLTAA